jgi:two-component system CheB/CheR fusion protein
MSTTKPRNIIAIGASAGGMEEIHHFFDNTPLDGVAYVIIQHLSPDFKSRMVELLNKHSLLKVKAAEEDMKVEKNVVYLIPSKKVMTIENGRLKLTDKVKDHAPHFTINTFFNSFAIDQGKKAIGVILSGMGSDGTEGVKAIKKAGGMVIARDPATTDFPSMPSNAIATGVVDFVLEPELMPQTILDYTNNAGYLEAQVFETKDDEKNMQDIIQLLNDQLPLDFSDYKPATILRRIKRKATQNNFDKLEDYLAFLKATPNEVSALAQDFLISVSSFFRDTAAFEVIEKKIIPEILKQNTDNEIKMWVPGCATGEEAYTLAILLCEQLNDKFKDTTVKIFATDVDNLALTQAGKGVYSESITRIISPERIEKHFTKEGTNYKVKPDIRKMLIFAHHDIVKNPPYCNMNLISCRNMLIYMTPVLQKKIFDMLLFGLKKNGFLFLGPSENPLPIMENLEIVDKKWKIYKIKESKRTVLFDGFSLPTAVEIKPTFAPLLPVENYENPKSTLTDTVNKMLVEELGYTVVCIDEQNEVIKTFGDTAKYMLQKNFTLNLTELLPKPLAVAFASATRKALQSQEKVVIKGIKIENNPLAVNMLVKPLDIIKSKQKLLLVLFSDDNTAGTFQQQGEVFDTKIYLDEYVVNMEQELKELKDELHITYEKLDASNEHMHSFNEELLSANEEMQSTNEEMQSINEELHTINADYQAKNKELVELNDDLNNYFRSNLNGQLFVNCDLQLMKFSPGTVKHINLLESDIGRPLGNISTNIKFETIEADIKEVITKGGVVTKEVEDNNGKWYQIMTMPYVRQADNKTDGAIITFNDISELKKIQIKLDNTNKNLLRINADLDNFVLTASHDLLGPLSNIEVTVNLLNQLKNSNPELDEYLKIINNSVKKFQSLIKELSMIGKIESDIFKTEAIDLKKMIDEIVLSIENKMKSSKAIITTDLPIAEVQFSKKNLRSILFNLISNSLKYKSDKHRPHIKITTEMEEDFMVLSVQDDGVGIPKNDLHKIFNLYHQLQHDQEGEGIGLYLVKKVVEAAGGKIIVESEPDTGSTFKIYIKAEPVLLKKPSLN